MFTVSAVHARVVAVSLVAGVVGTECESANRVMVESGSSFGAIAEWADNTAAFRRADYDFLATLSMK